MFTPQGALADPNDRARPGFSCGQGEPGERRHFAVGGLADLVHPLGAQPERERNRLSRLSRRQPENAPGQRIAASHLFLFCSYKGESSPRKRDG